MAKAWSITSNQRGFSPIEALLAATIFGTLVIGLLGAVVYGRQSTADAGDRARAIKLSEEGTEAVRNIRDAGYSNLVNGTYGLVQSGNQWTLSGSSDTSDIYTRSVTVADGGTNRKTITCTVNWTRANGSTSTSVSSQLTNWAASIAPSTSWSTPIQQSNFDLSGNATDIAVATQGNYAYVVRTVAPTLAIVNISNPAAPTLAGSATITGTPTDITVSGNYAYITTNSDTGELRIYNISNPAAPTLAGTYDAPGTADGRATYVIGTTVHLVRSANAANYEYVRINAANPAAPVAVANYNSNISMYDVYSDGTTVWIGTSSDSQEIIRLSATQTGLVALVGSNNLTGTTDVTTLLGYGTTLAVIQGTALRMVVANVVAGSLTMAGTVYDMTYDPTLNLIFVGTTSGTAELQIVNPANTAAPVVYSTLNMAGTLQTYAMSYSSVMDRLVITTNSTTTDFTIARPGP